MPIFVLRDFYLGILLKHFCKLNRNNRTDNDTIQGLPMTRSNFYIYIQSPAK